MVCDYSHSIIFQDPIGPCQTFEAGSGHPRTGNPDMLAQNVVPTWHHLSQTQNLISPSYRMNPLGRTCRATDDTQHQNPTTSWESFNIARPLDTRSFPIPHLDTGTTFQIRPSAPALNLHPQHPDVSFPNVNIPGTFHDNLSYQQRSVDGRSEVCFVMCRCHF